MTYDNIISKITEIIVTSNKMKSIYDNYFNDDEKKYEVINNFYILNEYSSEFKELLNSERTYFEYTNTKNPLLLNNELLAKCKNHLSSNNQDEINEYKILCDILERANDKDLNLLIEFRGYYVLKEDFNNFKRQCQRLKVGPEFLVNNIKNDKSELESRITRDIKKVESQKMRILNHLHKQDHNSIIYANKNYNSDIKANKFKDIIILAVSKKIGIEDLKVLINIHSREEIMELLDELEERKLFSKDDIERFKSDINNSCLVTNDMNDIVGMLYSTNNINIDGIKALAKFKQDSYSILITRLYELNIITYEEYLKCSSEGQLQKR